MKFLIRIFSFFLPIIFILSCSSHISDSTEDFQYIYFTAYEYVNGPKNIYRYDLNSEKLNQLTSGDRAYYHTFMSDLIGYYKQDQGEFWTMTYSGSEQQYLFSSGLALLRPLYSSIDQKLYFFANNIDGKEKALCSIETTGQNFTVVNQPEMKRNIVQDISLDGELLLFLTVTDTSYGIYSFDIISQQYEEILTSPLLLGGITLTSDKSGVYYWIQDNVTTRSIWYIDIQTQASSILYTPDLLYPVYLDNSPDDNYLVMDCSDSHLLNGPWELYILNIQTKEVTQLTNEGFLAGDLDWIRSNERIP